MPSNDPDLSTVPVRPRSSTATAPAGRLPSGATGDSQEAAEAIESVVALLCGEVDGLGGALVTQARRAVPERHEEVPGRVGPAPEVGAGRRRWSARRGAASVATRLGLPGPWRRPDGPPAPPWVALLAAARAHEGTQVGVISRALILDGCTLNLAGYLPAELRQLDQGVGAIDLVVDAPDASMRTSVEPAPWLPADAGFRAGLLLSEATVDRSRAADEAWSIRLDHAGRSYPLVPIPGCDATPNGAVMDAVPPVPGAGFRFELVIGTTLHLRTRAVAPEIEVTSVTAVEGGLSLGLDPSTGLAGHVEHGVGAVWLERRGSSGRRRAFSAARRLDLHRRDSEWHLDPSTVEPPTGGSAEPDVWDLWAECRGPQGSWRTRPGRHRSDLLAPRDAAVLPAARSAHARGQLKLTPYVTLSRHLAVKVRVIPGPPADGGAPGGTGLG